MCASCFHKFFVVRVHVYLLAHTHTYTCAEAFEVQRRFVDWANSRSAKMALLLKLLINVFKCMINTKAHKVRYTHTHTHKHAHVCKYLIYIYVCKLVLWQKTLGKFVYISIQCCAHSSLHIVLGQSACVKRICCCRRCRRFS